MLCNGVFYVVFEFGDVLNAAIPATMTTMVASPKSIQLVNC